jgi:hypothetical protein
VAVFIYKKSAYPLWVNAYADVVVAMVLAAATHDRTQKFI